MADFLNETSLVEYEIVAGKTIDIRFHIKYFVCNFRYLIPLQLLHSCTKVRNIQPQYLSGQSSFPFASANLALLRWRKLNVCVNKNFAGVPHFVTGDTSATPCDFSQTESPQKPPLNVWRKSKTASKTRLLSIAIFRLAELTRMKRLSVSSLWKNAFVFLQPADL